MTSAPDPVPACRIPTSSSGGRDEDCRGGLWWNTARDYKNAITNELFLTLAALLHQRTPGDSSAFILANARSVWVNNQNAHHQFGLRWTGPFDRADAAGQNSALDGLNAAVALAG